MSIARAALIAVMLAAGCSSSGKGSGAGTRGSGGTGGNAGTGGSTGTGGAAIDGGGGADAAAGTSGQWVMGYYVGYDIDAYPIASIDWTALTHVIFAPLTVNADFASRAGSLEWFLWPRSRACTR